MLRTLRIRNLAIIDDVELVLEPGMTVLTGETGAGKSIIVSAFGLVFGDRADTDLVRQGSAEAEVEALFDVPPGHATHVALDERGLLGDDGAFVVRRVVSRSGKGRVYANGRLAAVSDLRTLVGPLVDLSSQHAHTSLLDVTTHRTLLDGHGSLDSDVAAYGLAFQEWRAAREQLREAERALRERAEREEVVRQNLAELDEAAVRPGEELELGIERDRLRHAETLLEASSQAERLLYGERNAIVDRLTEAWRALRQAATHDPARLGPLVERVESARIELRDVADELRHYRDHVALDPSRLEHLEERLQLLRRLMRKYGATLEAVVARQEALRAELEGLAEIEATTTRLQAAEQRARVEVDRRAATLSEARQRLAREVDAAVALELNALGMGGSRLRFEVRRLTGDPGPHGIDDVEMLLSPNVGEPLMPLAKIASGGELSRVMLALKHVLAASDGVQTYVFDEVDTGVSGAVAERVGQKLRETARHRQVLCITHLPQVACQAEHHVQVSKRVVDGRTLTTVAELHGDARRDEIARLLAGVEVTEHARVHAAELLRLANR